MFKQTIAAVKAAEEAAQAELDKLWVEFDPKTGSGGVHWHAAGSGILQNAIRGLAGLREELERRQANDDAAAEQAKADAERAAAAEAATQPTAEQTAEAAALAATVQAKKLADEAGVDLTQVHGSGEGGKITKADVEAALPPNATETAIAHAAGLGLDVRAIKGTGVDGRVTKADVDAAVAAQEGAKA